LSRTLQCLSAQDGRLGNQRAVGVLSRQTRESRRRRFNSVGALTL
jgi:hypothetical protein